MGTFEQGLSIGSYLSQFLCNLYMSELYHYIKEGMYKIRRGKRKDLVRYCLIYMDDVLLIGTDKRDMRKAVKLVKGKAEEMGLTVKENYQIKEIMKHCIDMLGYKIYRTHTEIRKRIFLRIRRAYRKAKTKVSVTVARKCLSYYGYLKHTDSRRIERKWKVRSVVRKCKRVIKREAQNMRIQDRNCLAIQNG